MQETFIFLELTFENNVDRPEVFKFYLKSKRHLIVSDCII
jgi:hypothetical protein